MLSEWEQDTTFLAKFDSTSYSVGHALVCSQAINYYKSSGHQFPHEEIYSHISRTTNNNHFLKVIAIIDKIGQAKKKRQNMQESIIRISGLDSKSTGLDFFNSHRIPSYYVTFSGLDFQYPPHGHHIFESVEIGDEWYTELMEEKLADKY